MTTYTITGASDWPMLATIGGVAFALFHIVVFAIIWRWVDIVSRALQTLTATVEQNKTDMLHLRHDLTSQISAMQLAFQKSLADAIQAASDRADEKNSQLHGVHSALRKSDLAELKQLRVDLDQGMARCHEKREASIAALVEKFEECKRQCEARHEKGQERVFDAIESCQRECCPKGRTR